MRRAIIFDVDGTLCDVRTVRHHVMGENRNFHLFHEESTGCPPIFRTRVLWFLAGLFGFARIVVTARQARFFNHTLWWLLLNGFRPDDMFMRGWNDTRPDSVVKEEIVVTIRARGYNVVAAVDDNPAVIEVWRRNGIRTVTIPGFEG
jgi:FMN phosphatase YigB (HAD superfamily)